VIKATVAYKVDKPSTDLSNYSIRFVEEKIDFPNTAPLRQAGPVRNMTITYIGFFKTIDDAIRAVAEYVPADHDTILRMSVNMRADAKAISTIEVYQDCANGIEAYPRVVNHTNEVEIAITLPSMVYLTPDEAKTFGAALIRMAEQAPGLFRS
jgi:hypothetical protein